MRVAELRTRLDDLYAHYDHRFVDPDPLQFVRQQRTDADREVVGLIASALAYGNVKQIKRRIGRNRIGRRRCWRRVGRIVGRIHFRALAGLASSSPLSSASACSKSLGSRKFL